jgi:hypothetical protein
MKKLALILTSLFLFVFAANAQTNPIPQTPIKTHRESINKIKIIFEMYVNAQESTDSEANKTQMKKSLESLIDTKEPEELDLLINVWMYYDPTDFPTRQLVLKALEKNKLEAKVAVKNRIKNKRTEEKKGVAPYSELNGLMDQLK